ncbi:MAG TPA: cation-transporting P-type ATPase [Methylomirabilota bacterium]|nr:cation-transporting P-type ATPase [Methylomirabilota bacterium]
MKGSPGISAVPPAESPRIRPWHTLDAERVAALLGTDATRGLTTAEARRRLARVGPNRVGEAPETPLWRLAVSQFESLVVLLLLAAAAVALAIGQWAEGLAILAALLMNAAIGFATEWRAGRSLARLRALIVPRARVRRDGRVTTLAAAELAPGDLVLLEAGAQVPADARLVRSAALQLDEAPLTGESLPVDKDAEARVEAGAAVAEHATMVYLGTTVLAGSGAAIVTATGVATQLGRVGQLVALAGDRATPLERQIEGLGRRLAAVGLGVCAIVAAAGILHGQPVPLMLETGITLAVAAIPEGLPAVIAVALAAGLWRLARAGALVRRLPAVETLGSTTIICSDKTGTMTENRMAVVRVALDGRVIDVGGSTTSAQGPFTEDGRLLMPGDDPALAWLLTVGVLVNDAAVEVEARDVRLHGDPTEAALLVAALKAGLDLSALARTWPRRRELPFSPVTRLMATFHAGPDGARALLVKGAPGAVLERSRLDDEARQRLQESNRGMAAEGFRVLALAWRPDVWPEDDRLDGLSFLGFVAFADPLRPGVKEALARCREAGIAIMMLTGDQRSTAEAVGRQLGLPPESIRSRVTPEDKLELVKTLQARGEVVAMTGDGVNDAPALVRADIGIAMGRHGTDVAREAADLVLVDDDFGTIVGAVREGRVIYTNLGKVIQFLFSCNLSEILVVFAAILAGFPSPLAPLQILWVNLVTDILPAMALVRDPAEPDVMRRPPRDPRQPLVTWSLSARILAEGACLAAGVLSAYGWVLLQEGPGPRAHAVAFVALVLVHPMQALHCRSAGTPWWRLPPNPLVWAALGVLVAVQWGAVSWPPLAGLLGSAPLAAGDWLLVGAAVVWPVALLEAIKSPRRERRRRDP